MILYEHTIVDFCATYGLIMENLSKYGVFEENLRTHKKIRSLPGGVSFRVSLENNILPVPNNRKYFPHIAAAETTWQFSGDKDSSFIKKYAPKLWSKFENEKGEIPAAYGYRWRKHFGRDQLNLAISALKKDPSNRQIFISAWDPSSDGLGSPNQPKNIPCPVGFTLSIHNESLYMSVFIRSSDIAVGLPYDVMSYSLTLDAIAATLSLKPGFITFTLAHAHIYEDQFDLLIPNDEKKLIKNPKIRLPLPGWSITSLVAAPDLYIENIKIQMSRQKQTDYNPLIEVVV